MSSIEPSFRQSIALLFCILLMYLAFFGFRSELILYVTSNWHYTDDQAYSLYGTFTGICSLTPIIGGWLVDQKIDLRLGVFASGLILILGYLFIHIESLMQFAIALMVLGIGIFDAFIICLIADYYGEHPEHKASIMTYYYIAMNIGGMLGAPSLAFVTKYYSYQASFLFAAVCIAVSLVMLYLSLHTKINKQQLSSKALLMFCLIYVIIVSVIYFNLTGLLVIVAISYTLYSSQLFHSKYRRENKRLLPLGIVSLFATCYWILGQQPAGSINLFIARNINLHDIPAAAFQATDPVIIILTGPLIAWLWRVLHKRNVQISFITKVLCGFGVLCLGFLCLWLAGLSAQRTGQGYLFLPILALSLIGFSELFINPVLYSEITSQVPIQIRGRCTALFLTITGAPGNFLAAKLADLTAGKADQVSVIESAVYFTQAYRIMFYFGVVAFLALLLFKLVMRKHR